MTNAAASERAPTAESTAAETSRQQATPSIRAHGTPRRLAATAHATSANGVNGQEAVAPTDRVIAANSAAVRHETSAATAPAAALTAAAAAAAAAAADRLALWRGTRGFFGSFGSFSILGRCSAATAGASIAVPGCLRTSIVDMKTARAAGHTSTESHSSERWSGARSAEAVPTTPRAKATHVRKLLLPGGCSAVDTALFLEVRNQPRSHVCPRCDSSRMNRGQFSRSPPRHLRPDSGGQITDSWGHDHAARSK